jgi:hypothetical protein
MPQPPATPSPSDFPEPLPEPPAGGPPKGEVLDPNARWTPAASGPTLAGPPLDPHGHQANHGGSQPFWGARGAQPIPSFAGGGRVEPAGANMRSGEPQLDQRSARPPVRMQGAQPAVAEEEAPVRLRLTIGSGDDEPAADNKNSSAK